MPIYMQANEAKAVHSSSQAHIHTLANRDRENIQLGSGCTERGSEWRPTLGPVVSRRQPCWCCCWLHQPWPCPTSPGGTTRDPVRGMVTASNQDLIAALMMIIVNVAVAFVSTALGFAYSWHCQLLLSTRITYHNNHVRVAAASSGSASGRACQLAQC